MRKRFPTQTFRKTLWFRTFVILLTLSFFTVFVCIFYLNQIILSEKNESISNILVSQLVQTRNDMDSVISVLSTSLSSDLWSGDNLELLLSLNLDNQSRNTRIVNSLKNAVTQNYLITGAALYSPQLDYVFLSTGIWLAREDYERAQVINHYMETRSNRSGEQTSSGGRFYRQEDLLYLYFELETPIHVGTLLYTLNQNALFEMATSGNQNLIVLDSQGQFLFGTSGEPPVISAEELHWIDSEQEENSYGSIRDGYYATTSSQTGWTYLLPVEFGSMWDYLPDLLSLMIPFLLIYAAICILAAWNTSSHLYQPIHSLLMLAASNSDPESRASWANAPNEAAFLKQYYENALEKNQQYQQALETVSQDVREQCIYKLLRGRELPPEEPETTLRTVGGEALLDARFIVLAGLLFMKEIQDNASVEWVIFRRSLSNLFHKFRPQTAIAQYLYYMTDDHLAVVLAFSKETSVTEIKHLTSTLLDNIQQPLSETQATIFWGRSMVCEELRGLLASWHTALENAQRQGYSEQSKDTAEAVGTLSGYPAERKYLSEEIKTCLILSSEGKREECDTRLQLFFDQIFSVNPENGASPYERLQDITIESLMNFGLELKEVEQLTEKYQLNQSASISAEEYPLKLQGFIRESMRLIQINGRKNRFKYVEEAIDYINRHYMDSNLSLEMVSEYVGITSTYLSTLFREIQKERFNTYLNSYRVEQAKILLRTTTLSNADIGFRCGFNSNQSFYRVFKKVTETTPNGYRDQQKKGEMPL